MQESGRDETGSTGLAPIALLEPKEARAHGGRAEKEAVAISSLGPLFPSGEEAHNDPIFFARGREEQIVCPVQRDLGRWQSEQRAVFNHSRRVVRRNIQDGDFVYKVLPITKIPR